MSSKFIMGLRIKAKLLFAFGSILLLSVILIIFSLRAVNRILDYKLINEEVDSLLVHLIEIDLDVREFSYQGYKSSEFQEKGTEGAIERFKKSFQHSLYILGAINSSHVMNNEQTVQMTADLREHLEKVGAEFNQLVALLKKRGFKDYGLEGELRKAIHDVESSSFPYDKASLLMLRRHEKDFFLRKDLAYQKSFNNQVDEFKEIITGSAVKDGERVATITKKLSEYREKFNDVVEIEHEIGLTESEGIKGVVRADLADIKGELEKFRILVKNVNNSEISQIKIFLAGIFAFQLLVGLSLAVLYANLLTKSIKEIRTGMQKLAEGTFPEKLRVKTTEEIGQTKTAFNQFIDRLFSASSFAEELGKGKLSASYDERFNNDVLAHALTTMQVRLRDSEEKQRVVNWTNSGMASFNEIIKVEDEDLGVLSDQILKFVVTYLEANQGALYIIARTNGEEFIERKATYAYQKKKFVNERLESNAGLVGQCALEGSTIFMNEVPASYIKITSGLGEATPRSIILVPLKHRNEVMGVIELASFKPFNDHQIKFVEKIAESIAAILSARKMQLDTKMLLEESQARANQLAQQEEEMRQNAEEIQATQEEMERQRNELQEEIRTLKKHPSNGISV